MSDFAINRFEELNNYSGLMTRYKMVIQMRIKAYARAATIMDGTGSRRHQGPAQHHQTCDDQRGTRDSEAGGSASSDSAPTLFIPMGLADMDHRGVIRIEPLPTFDVIQHLCGW